MNQAIAATFAQLDAALEQHILDTLPADITPEDRESIRTKPYWRMVEELAKPGDKIQSELTLDKFITLLRASVSMINHGEQLDRAKKITVYNKNPEEIPVPDAYLLPTTSGINKAFENLTPEKAHLLHMAIGLAGEGTEMLQAIVNHILGADLDTENLVEESGDSLFYLQGIINSLQLMSLAGVALANKVKLLGKRYRKGYSDAAAQARADKPAGE